MARCDPRAMRPARLMGATYAALLDRLERAAGRDSDRPVTLPQWQKLWIAAAVPAMSRVHVVGAGMAGLAAALALVDAGPRVTLYEAGPAAGGRCRSYHDKELGCRIDNGNHLWLSGNRRPRGFLRRVGAAHTQAGPPDALFPFIDLATGERWTVRPNAGRLPWWMLRPAAACRARGCGSMPACWPCCGPARTHRGAGAAARRAEPTACSSRW